MPSENAPDTQKPVKHAAHADSPHPFDYRDAIAFLTKKDRRLAAVIEKSIEFRLNIDESQTPYESLLRAIAYQSISGKVAADDLCANQSPRNRRPLPDARANPSGADASAPQGGSLESTKIATR